MKVLIVDDEPLALDVLETHISKIPQLEIVQRCANALEANEALKSHEIDLIFLDIQMPEITGIEFLKTISDPPLVIFTTAYSNYAIEGFELNAVDYLLKPISFERLLKAVNRALEMDEMRHGKNEKSSSEPTSNSQDFVFVKADKKLIKVFYDDILYIEGLKDYVIIKLDQSRVITLQTMKSLEEKLPNKTFKRIHRSFILNINKILAIVGNMVEIKEKNQIKHLPIGKNYREELLNLVQKNKL